MLEPATSHQLSELLHGAFQQALPADYMSLRSAETVMKCQTTLMDVLQVFVQSAFSVHRHYIRRLNETNVTNRLPHELLLAIFHALPTTERIRATHVCHHWRAIALGAPSLWTVIENPTRGALLALPELLARSGSAPLSLHVPKIPTFHDVIWTLHMVKDYSRRLRSLEIAPFFDVPAEGVGYDLPLDCMLLLRDVRIKWPSGSDRWLRLSPVNEEEFKALLDVELFNVDGFDCFALFTSMTRLSLNLTPGCTTYRLVSNLAQCPSLRHLELTLSMQDVELRALTEAETASVSVPSLSHLTVSGILPAVDVDDPSAILLEALRSFDIPSISYRISREGHGSAAAARSRRAERLLLSGLTRIVHYGFTHLTSRAVEIEDERGYCRTADFTLRDFDGEYQPLESVIMLGVPFESWSDLRAAPPTFDRLERLTIVDLPGNARWRHAQRPACPKLRSLTLAVGDGNPDALVETAVDFVQYYIAKHPLPLEQVILVGNRPQRLLSAIRELQPARRDLVRAWEFLPAVHE